MTKTNFICTLEAHKLAKEMNKQKGKKPRNST